jgi:hypothetical protein
MKQAFIVLIHTLFGWILCGAIIGIGFQLTSEQNTLIIHAIGAPIIFGLLSWNYFSRFAYTSPLQTAFIFLAFAVGMDFFVVSILIKKDFSMFASVLGTWIPFLFIFLSTYFVGRIVQRRRPQS